MKLLGGMTDTKSLLSEGGLSALPLPLEGCLPVCQMCDGLITGAEELSSLFPLSGTL